MARGPAKCEDWGIYIKLSGEELKVELENYPDSDGYICILPMQCKSERVAKACVKEYIDIGRLEPDVNYVVRRRFAA